MNSDITDKDVNAWLLFDGQCPFCLNTARRFAPLLHRHGFALLPLQTAWVKERLSLTEEELLYEMRLLTKEGRLYGGADAVMQIARAFWWAKPLTWLYQLPVLKPLARAAYRCVARHRYFFGGGPQCSSGSCSVSRPKRNKRVFFEMP